MRAAIIADDLTGACDAAARAALAGWTPRVVFRGPAPGNLVVVSTASRTLPPEQAAGVVTRAVQDLLTRGVRPIFKKIDSTLRGPWAHEVAAMRAALRAEIVAVCPAFPACGRTVRNGSVYCDGEPVGPVAEPLQAAGIADAILGDAATEEELAAFAAGIAEQHRSVLWVGSAGLAQFALPPRAKRPRPVPKARRWVVIVGSTHAATLAQIEAARAAGIPVMADPPANLDAGTGLFLIGGDTAEAAARRLNVSAMDVFGEALPGISCGRFAGGPREGVPFLTKAGGFGTPDAVLRAIESASCGSE